jgi:hypothetical protein
VKTFWNRGHESGGSIGAIGTISSRGSGERRRKIGLFSVSNCKHLRCSDGRQRKKSGRQERSKEGAVHDSPQFPKMYDTNIMLRERTYANSSYFAERVHSKSLFERINASVFDEMAGMRF